MEEFKAFVKNLDLNIAFVFNRNPYLTAVIGYFNANSRNWYKGNKTSPSGSQIGIMTSDYGFTQIINEPTHILKDYLSWIGLVITTQPNIVLDIEVDSSLHTNFHR